MPLRDAVAKLRIQFRAAVLWGRANRLYDRAIKHLDRGLMLKEKGDKYIAQAEAVENRMRGVRADG